MTKGSKYTPDQPQAMARRCIQANNHGDPRAVDLVMIVSHYTGLDPDEVWRNIVALAGGDA